MDSHRLCWIRLGRGTWCLWLHTPWWKLGLHGDDGCDPLFSERYGFTKVWRFRGLMLVYRPKRTWMNRFQNEPR